jgi:hypothetical protein
MNDEPRIVYDDALRLALYRPAGVFDMPLVERVLIFMLALEDSHPEPFDRLVDFTAIAEIRLSSDQMYYVSRLRRDATARRRPFRTAILAPTPIGYGMGRMYEVLMEGSAVQVGVFRDATGAANWLGLPRAVVEPPGAVAK